MALKRNVIIVAGGSGKRMQSQLPKQFLTLAGKPVLMHTLDVFFQTLKGTPHQIVLALPETQIEKWEWLCRKHHCNIPHLIVKGGSQRFFSVKNALEKITDGSLVAIHDGVRPMVFKEVIRRCFDVAEKSGTAVPVVQISESMRKIERQHSAVVSRANYVLVQTPQVFHSTLIKKAYQIPYTEQFTDDASVAEFYGENITLVEGNQENIKITLPSDLKYAEWLICEVKNTK